MLRLAFLMLRLAWLQSRGAISETEARRHLSGELRSAKSRDLREAGQIIRYGTFPSDRGGA